MTKTQRLLEPAAEVRITDHALLRYLDRVEGYNIEEARRQIVDDQLKAYVSIVGGNGKVPVGDGKHMFVVKNSAIVSVVPK